MIARVLGWARALTGRHRLEAEMTEEMQAHIAFRAADLERAGVAPQEALRQARADFGSLDGTKEAARQALGLRLWDEFRGDLRYAFRTLGRSRAHAAVILLTLLLGIGATTAIFSSANALFFRPLPFGDPDRLVHFFETNPEFQWVDAHAAPANVIDWRERMRTVSDIAMYNEEFRIRFPLAREGEVILLEGTQVSGNFFDVLGVRPMLGRGFTWEETFEGRPGVIVLSHALWHSHFAADPAVLGRRITAGTSELEIIGVMPPGFVFPAAENRFWVPYGWADSYRASVSFRRAHFVRVVGRLADGASLAGAQAELQAVVAQLQTEYPATNRVMGAGLAPTRSFLIRHARQPLTILLGAAGVLLLLACVNTVTLAMVRAADRSGEFAVRQALGAGRARVARQLVVEALLLSLAGGAGGLALGWAGVRLMQRLTPIGVAGATDLALDLRVVGVAFLAALVVGVVVGLIPALARRGESGHHELREVGRTGEGIRGRSRAARTLVAVEVALALILVLGAGLLLRTILGLRAVDSGFQTEGVVAVQFAVPAVRYPARDQVLAFYDRFAELLEARPGVRRVGTVGQLPLAGTSWSSQFVADGWAADRVGSEILHRRADPGYFEALGIPLVHGRMFDGRDRADGPFVVLVNEQFAREHFPGEDPIGRRITYNRVPDSTSIWYEIVGVVGDQQQVTQSRPARAEVFENRNQDWNRNVWTVVRGEGETAATVAAIREALRELDPAIPIAAVRPLVEVWRDAMAREQFLLVLLLVFGVVALALAAVGVYGVAAQSARRRTREVGIRMALGADAGAVIRLMVGQSFLVVAAGLALGLVVAIAAASVLRSVLFGVAPGDPATFAVALALLAAAALLASWLPARRATRLSPTVVLKDG